MELPVPQSVLRFPVTRMVEVPSFWGAVTEIAHANASTGASAEAGVLANTIPDAAKVATTATALML
ncbi:hypothetical protein Aab01nite_83770 [Paractinoplanes abujensis]|nr:hypothetical protein Aab01nite_83770 [Actinoplanes abujensis]